MSFDRTYITAALAAGTLVASTAGQGTRSYVVTDAAGTRLAHETGWGEPGAGLRTPPEVLWTYDAGFSIPQNVALSGATNSAWVGEDLNSETLHRFVINGDGTPVNDFSHLGADFTTVSASRTTDRAAILFRLNNILTIHSYSSASSDFDWSFDFPAEYNTADYAGMRISRDGSRVCVLVANPTQGAFACKLYTFHAATGEFQSVWDFADYAGPIDVTDDGTQCLVTQGQNAHLIDTNDGTLITSFSGSGAGARFKISGDGRIVVLGGFSFYVYERQTDGSWPRVIDFNAPNSWFGWGTAVSRDGSTVAAMSHNYANGYLSTATRIWDVPSRTRLGVYNTNGTGGFQDSISGAALSDDGAILVVSSWGTEDNAHPEVMVFNRDVERIAEIDTPGSVFGLDMTGGGIYALSGSKGVHANTFGNGGHVNLLQIRCLTADFDCDCEVDLSDLASLLIAFGACEGQPAYSALLDLDASGCVDLGDLARLLIVFGNRCGA